MKRANGNSCTKNGRRDTNPTRIAEAIPTARYTMKGVRSLGHMRCITAATRDQLKRSDAMAGGNEVMY